MIRVIDSIMGSGKTQAMYRTIRENPDTPFLFITPYLSTIQDAIDNGLSIEQPEHRGSTKLENLKYLLSHGHNIACTHALFLGIDDELLSIIRNSGYSLFIDEALDVVKSVNDLIDDPGHRVKRGTARFLIQQGIIDVDSFCKVRWCAEHVEDDYEYAYLEPLIKSGNVICIDDQLFLWMFPPEIFNAFEKVTILSYLFKGSVFDAYLRINHLEYTLGGVTGNYKDGFSFSDYQDDAEKRKILKKHIALYDGKANDLGEKKFALSANWYDSAKPKEIQEVKNGFNTFLKNAKSKIPNAKVMWTCYKDQKELLSIKGAGYVRNLSPEETRAVKADPDCKDRELNKIRCFVSCNARGTNAYDDRQILAFLVNRFYQPQIKKWLSAMYRIQLDEERYALSEMIQWIWRSAIRKESLTEESRKIYLYIPSRRMRNLLLRWLDGEAI